MDEFYTESSIMKTWIAKQLKTLDEWDTPEPDQQLFEDCGAMVREGAERAASAGLLEQYTRHKRTRHCTPQDARAVLSSILAPNGSSPDYVTNEMPHLRAASVDCAKRVLRKRAISTLTQNAVKPFGASSSSCSP